MLEFLELDQYSNETLVLIALTIFIGGAFVGIITDLVMRNRGFGPIGNGLLVVLGCYIGIHARNHFDGYLRGEEILRTGILAATFATTILLVFGVIKSWITD